MRERYNSRAGLTIDRESQRAAGLVGGQVEGLEDDIGEVVQDMRGA